MQISSRILLACLVTAVLLPNISQAAETEAQKKARQALEQKLQELNAQTPAPEVQAPAKPAPAKPKPAEPKVEVKKPEPAPAPAKPAPAKPAPAPAKAPEQATAQSGAFFEPVPTEAANPNLEKAEQALRERMKQAGAQVGSESAPAQDSGEAAAPDVKPNKQAKAQKAGKSKDAQAFAPLQGPATGFSAEKEQKLKALLDDYRADKLTPSQYHEQRAKILAEP